MPYIEPEKREEIDIAANNLAAAVFDNGSLNYAISKLIHQEFETRFLNYENLNDIIGVLECVKQEFYRTVIAPYEDKKRLENGAVSKLDDNWEERIR